MAQKNITNNELNNVSGGTSEKTKINKCGSCKSQNLSKIKKSDGCSEEIFYHCNDCGHEDKWEKS